MALQKDLNTIKEKLKKLAAELVAQGISDKELKERLKQEKEKLLPTKKDQLQETGAAVEANKASDTVSSLESGSSDSQAKIETPVQETEVIAVEQDQPDPIKKPNIKDQSKAGAIQLYEDMYSTNGFEFEDSMMAGSVSVLAPNGKSQRFRVESGGGRRGKKVTDWTSVDKFIEENNDEEAWSASKKQRSSLTSIVENIVEREDYYNFLDLEGVAIKDSEDLLYNHPDVVKGIEKEAIKRYNQYNVEDREKTVFGDTAFQVSGITDNRLKIITSQAIQTEIQKDKVFDLKQEEDLIVKEAAENFNGSTNSLVDYYTKIGALGISNPTERTIASDWSSVYNLQQKLKGKELSTTERLAFEKQLADASQKAKALTKQYIDPNNSVLFDFENNTTEITTKSDPESKSVNITNRVELARAELANLKSTDFGSLQRRYVVNNMELSDIEKRLNKEYEVVQSDGVKRLASLRSLVGQYITGEGKFGGAMTEGLKAYGEKSENSESGTIQEVLDKTSIGLAAEEYLELKGEAEALKQMYLLNIDPGSVERTGFFGALGESFLESVSSPDVVDYYTGKNSSDLLFTAQSVGNEAGIEWNEKQKKNFKETTSEFVGTSLGGLPVLAAEFAVANVAAGVALGATGLEAGLTALKVGKYYKNGRKGAMTLDEITTAAAADGYKGSILSKPVQTWIKNQANITKVGGGVVDQGKALFVESMVEGLKMESVMGEGGFSMGAAFLPAASLTNKLIGRLGLGFKAKGAFAPLNDIVLKPAKSGLVMIPSAEGGAAIEAAIENFAGGESFGKYIDENFKGEFYGEGGIGRRLLGHAVAGFGLSYSHLNPKTVFKSLKEQKVLRANAITEYKNIQNRIKQEQLLEGSESRIDLLEQEGAKQLEVYTLANNFISNAYALNAATDPQTSAKQAQKDIQKARQDFKKLTGKEMDMNFSIEMQGEGMEGKAASATKLENGTWDVKVDARKYHKGIFGHELGHFYSDVFKINDSEGLGKIVNFVNETVKKTTGTDVKALVNSKYEGKQDAETLNEEYMMALVETLGKNDSSGLVNKNAFGDIANSLKGLYERKMKPFYKEGNVPEMRIESPQELLTLLQRISKGAGKGGNVKQWQQLQGLYIQNKKIFNGKSKEVFGEYGSENVSAEIESQIEALESKLENDEIDYDSYESQLTVLENKLEAAKKGKETKPLGKTVEVFHGGEVKTVNDIDGNIYFSENKGQAEEYAKGNYGKVRSFKINENEIATEKQVFEVIRELDIQPRVEGWTVNDSRLYELIDDRFENAFTKKDLNKLNEALAAKGIKAARFTDSDLKTGKDAKNIVLFDKSAVTQETKSEVPKTPSRTYTKREKLEKIDIDKQYEELTKLREENKAIAEKFGKDPIKGAAEKRIENEIIESLSDPIGKLITGRTKALFDPIPEDARAGVTRKKFQESMRSDLTAMVLNEYRPGKQSAEKFLINRGYLRANNLAKRLGIQSAEAGINKGMEAAEKVATETSVSESVPEGRLIEPVERLITDPKLKKEFIEKVNEATKDLTPEQVNYKNLTDAAPELTEKIFGEVFKEVKGKTKLDKAKTLKQRQQFIRNNAELLYKLLPEGARKMADKFSTSTGIQSSLLKNFYEKGERVDMTKGTEAGLATQTKKPFNETVFLELFGANKNQKPSRNHETAITALIKETGKAMTNRAYRQSLESERDLIANLDSFIDGQIGPTFDFKGKTVKKTGEKEWTLTEEVVDEAGNVSVKEIAKVNNPKEIKNKLGVTADISMNTIQKIADGKSVNMASENISNDIGISFLENRVTEEDFKKLVSTVSKNLPKYYGELTPELINSAAKRNQFVEDVVAERILAEAGWNIAYKKANIPYTKLSEVGNDAVGKDGKVERPELVKGLKILAEEFGDIESLPPFIRKTLLATLGVNQRLLINGNKISQKATGTTNSKDMLNSVFGELNFKDGSQNLDYKYAYAPTPGKGKWNKAEVGGKGFNGKVESKIASLREKYKNNTDSNEFRQELSDFVRKELTHPELRGQADGFDLTVQANTKLLEKTYNTLYDAVKSGKLSVQGATDVLRIQTNHGTGIFKLLVPYESVTMGGIGKYRRGDKKNTHNEHMVELQNYNLDFVEILNSSKNTAEAKEAITALVDGLGQSIIDVPTQRVKDSKRYGGSSKQVYADRVLNTFLRTNSLNNSLVISGPYKGYTQGEKLFQELGADGLRKALDRVDSKRRGKQWTEISEALNKLKERKLASENLGEEFGKIVTRTSGETRSFSDVTAKIEAGQKGKYKFFVSASADDFVGLMNYNAGKGKRGEADQEFFKKNLYEPYAEANTLISKQNVQMAKQFKDIKKHIESNSPDFNLTKKVPGSKFTYEQALRVAIWDKQGYEIPGLSKVETENLKGVIDSNVDLQVLALNLKRIAGGEYVKPNKDWFAGDIAGDLRLGLNTTLRTKYLKDWKNNVDAMFTPEALNKLEAIHGTPYRKSLEEMLDAMYTGKTRRTSPNSLEGRSLNYLNNSVGTIMFLNQRSATLQMLSSFNYINWSDNNPLQAGKALANIPQFAKDFKTLFNSDWAKSRREGLRINVTESEIAEAVNGSKNIPKSITAFLLKKGFLPTQIADSMATALGGSSFYRNRTNTYVKEGMAQEKAEAKAMQDWVEISETNQQSSRPDKISSQQRSDLGKLLLAFANTPMQYTRETKKALLDIKNNRGDIKTNLSKVAYYAFAQNAIFSGLQSAIFKMAWSDDEQDQIFLEKKAPKIINSMGDSFLRGMGIGGALVSTLKNAGIKLYERADRGSRARLKDVAFDLLDVSPPISSKVGKVYSALDAIDRAGGIEAATQAPIDLKNPLIKSGALMTEAFVNVPANRALQKIQTITEAASSNREWYEKLALLSGWKSWEIDPEVVYKSKKEKFSERKAKRQEVFKKMSYKDYQTYKRWKKLKVNNGKDIVDFVELKKGK